MSDTLLTLDHPIATHRPLTGAKGAALAEMMQTGLPVPNGFVISTEVFKLIIDKLPADTLKNIDTAPAQTQRHASTTLCQAIKDSALPTAIANEIRNAYAHLATTAISVRSSSTAEYLAHASFAGQYDSFLNITSIDELFVAIKKVWASLFSPHAINYRQRHGMAPTQAHMAVVVQRQLAPAAAGVLFTHDPQSGAKHYLVSAALGLGEGVVSGSAPTDHFTLDPRSGQLLTSDIADKHSQVVAAVAGGIETVETETDKKYLPALDADQLKELSAYGRQIERLFPAPQDIEFAIELGEIRILQARPITTLADVEEPDQNWTNELDKRYCWTHRRGPFYRLEQDFMVEYMRHARDCYEEVGSSMSANHIAHFSNGHMYTRVPQTDTTTLEKRHARQTKRVDDCFARGTTYFEDTLRGIIEKRLQGLKKQRRSSVHFIDLVAYLKACMETQGYVAGNLHWSMGRPKPLPSWHEEYHELSGRPAHEANTYLQAIDNRMTRLIAHLRELARLVQSDSALSTLFAEREFSSLSTMQNNAQTDHFHAHFEKMLATYGLRSGRGYGSSSGFKTPTWNMEPALALDIIASYAEQDLDQLDQLEKEARKERINATRRMRSQLKKDPEKLKCFNDGLLRATLHVRFLEDHNYYMEQCTGGTAREAIFAVGREMVRQNLIEHADDALHFSIAELNALAQSGEIIDQRSLVRARGEEWARRKKMQPLPTLGAAPEKKNNKTKSRQRAVCRAIDSLVSAPPAVAPSSYTRTKNGHQYIRATYSSPPMSGPSGPPLSPFSAASYSTKVRCPNTRPSSPVNTAFPP
jgi:hypothetical protein